MFKPTMLKSKVKRYNKSKKQGVIDKKDMERKFASAGPNKQMYEMYNMSLRHSAINEPIGFLINQQKFTPMTNNFANLSGENFNKI